MTESNITKEHEGKHGVLTLGDSHNDVTIGGVNARGFSARIDRANKSNHFLLSDGWQFTPDPEPLPTEPGWYVRASEAQYPCPVLYFLTPGERRWYHNYGDQANFLTTLEFIAGTHAVDPLVRVSFGVAS